LVRRVIAVKSKDSIHAFAAVFCLYSINAVNDYISLKWFMPCSSNYRSQFM